MADWYNTYDGSSNENYNPNCVWRIDSEWFEQMGLQLIPRKNPWEKGYTDEDTWKDKNGKVYRKDDLKWILDCGDNRKKEKTSAPIRQKKNPITNISVNTAPMITSGRNNITNGKNNATNPYSAYLNNSFPQEKVNKPETIFIDASSGKYLGHLNHFVDSDTNYTFPKYMVNVRAIESYDFKYYKNNPSEKINNATISDPITIDFDAVIKDIKSLIDNELEYDTKRWTKETFKPMLEQAMFFVYVKKEGSTIVNSIRSVILDYKKLNLANVAVSLDVFSFHNDRACYYIVKKGVKKPSDANNSELSDSLTTNTLKPIEKERDLQEEAAEYFTSVNKLPPVVSQNNVFQKLPTSPRYKPNDDRQFQEEVSSYQQFVICDCHTHPNLVMIDPYRTGKVIGYDDSAENSESDLAASKASLKPNLVLAFNHDIEAKRVFLDKIYIVTKKSPNSDKKKIYSFVWAGNDTDTVRSNFEKDIQNVLLNCIIKQYYDGEVQPS